MSDDDDVIVAIGSQRIRCDRQRFEEFARAFHDRKGCRHRIINDPQFVADVVSVLEQIPKRDAERT
jgi:hypothetical protein